MWSAKIGKDALGAFKEGLKSERPEVRLAAVAALSHAGPSAVADLVDALGNPNVEVRRLAAQVLTPLRISDRMVVVGGSLLVCDGILFFLGVIAGGGFLVGFGMSLFAALILTVLYIALLVLASYVICWLES